MSQDWKLRTVRADSSFFDQALLGFLEERSLPYIIVARMTRSLKAAAAAIKDWTPLDANYSAASFQLKLHGWSKERRFVVIRKQPSLPKLTVMLRRKRSRRNNGLARVPHLRTAYTHAAHQNTERAHLKPRPSIAL